MISGFDDGRAAACDSAFGLGAGGDLCEFFFEIGC